MISTCIRTLILDKCINIFFDKLIYTFKTIDLNVSTYSVGTVFDLHIKNLDKVLERCVLIKRDGDLNIVRCEGLTPNIDLTIKNNTVIDIKIVD